MKSNCLQLLTAFAVFFVVAAFPEEYEEIVENADSVLDAVKKNTPYEGYNLIQLGSLVDCAVRQHKNGMGSSVRSTLEYNNYGCWCGKGGAGKVVDATDQCCKDHDKCYEKLPGYQAYFLTYGFNCDSNGAITCQDLPGTNKKTLCDCDKEAAECFARNRKTYNFAKNVMASWRFKC